MSDDIVALAKHIARLKPNADAACYLDMQDTETELPYSIGPFSVRPEYLEGFQKTGTWRVAVAARTQRGDADVFSGLPTIFAAFRKMVDCVEAWQLIKPIERVYFIGSELRTGALVKVGFSRDPVKRLQNLQTAHGEKLHLFATVSGGKDLEAKYHRRWHARRRQGEWFVLGDCIINEIERIKADTAA